MPNLLVTDFLQLQQSIRDFGNTFRHTPLQKVFYDTSNKLSDAVQIGFSNNLSDEDMANVKAVLNDLKKDLENHRKNYADIELQSTIIDYNLWNIDAFNNNTFTISMSKTDSQRYTPLHGINKWGNLSITPSDNGANELPSDQQEEVDLAYAEEAKYTIDELNEAFVNCNIHNIVKTGIEYCDELKKVYASTSLNPMEKAEEDSFRQSLIEKAEAYREAINTNIQGENTNVERLFARKGYMKNTLDDGTRSYAEDLKLVDFDLKFFKSGLPLNSYNHIINLENSVLNLSIACKTYTTNGHKVPDDFKKAIDNLDNHLKAIPEENSSQAQIHEYGKQIYKDIDTLKKKYDALNPEDKAFFQKTFKEVNGYGYIFHNLEASTKIMIPFKDGIQHYIDTFDNTFKNKQHENTTQYNEMIKALKDYKTSLNGSDNINIVYNNLKTVQEKTRNYIKSKNIFQGWKGDGGVRYENAKALDNFVSHQIALLKSFRNAQNVNKSVQKTDLSSMMNKLEMNTINEPVKRTTPAKEYMINKDVVDYWNVMTNEARKPLSANYNSPEYIDFIHSIDNCKLASQKLYKNPQSQASKKEYAKAIDTLLKDAKAYEKYKLSDHTRFPELEPGKKPLNSDDKGKLEMTDSMLYDCKYTKPVAQKQAPAAAM